jgi:protein translocase SecG subunit
MAETILAYEPVWAIGTGRTATAQQAQEVHAFIRLVLASMFDDATASACGSIWRKCQGQQCRELMSQRDVDGALVGGASLEVRSFSDIIRTPFRVRYELTDCFVIDHLVNAASMMLILIQLPKKEAGAGLAFGAGATDALFGAGSGNALTKVTKYTATVFLVLVLALSILGQRIADQGSNRLELELKKRANVPPALPLAGASNVVATTPTNGATSSVTVTPLTNSVIKVAPLTNAANPRLPPRRLLHLPRLQVHRTSNFPLR